MGVNTLDKSINSVGVENRLYRFKPVLFDVLDLIARKQEVIGILRPHPTDHEPDRTRRVCGKKTYLMGTNCYFVGCGVLEFDQLESGLRIQDHDVWNPLRRPTLKPCYLPLRHLLGYLPLHA